eukprot:TRINITY_DN389_c0_g1_i1.p1 TRINITY_DN389_c0_g1~~TRINITY_DN389_c0_g1_i1.p1  ORF type:complete len:529 (+),score=77.35 TRINITY_DN389_c0_g1_i1:235-1821(+)
MRRHTETDSDIEWTPVTIGGGSAASAQHAGYGPINSGSNDSGGIKGLWNGFRGGRTSTDMDTFIGRPEDQAVAEKPKHKGPSLFGAYANLATGIVGVGILSYPYAFSHAGSITNIIMTVVFTALNIYSLYLLTAFAEQQIRLKTLSQQTYEELVRLTLGPVWYYVAVGFILILTLGALTAYLIVVADMGNPVFSDWISFHGGFRDFIVSRYFIIVAFAVIFAFPLSLLGNIHNLAISSIIAVLSILFVVAAVMYRGGEAIHDDAHHLMEHVKLFNWSPTGPVLAVPLCLFALGCQMQIVPIYAELDEKKRPYFTLVVAAAVATCAILYLGIGIVGYIQFGDDVEDNILKNFPNKGDNLIDSARITMCLHLILAYPVGLFPGRRCLDLLLNRLFKFNADPSLKRKVFQNILIIALTCLLACVLPQITFVFGMVGATGSVALLSLFPGLILWKMAPFSWTPRTVSSSDRASQSLMGDIQLNKGYEIEPESRWELVVRKTIAGGLLVFTVVAMVLCVAVEIYNDVQHPPHF